ncbi:MAG: ATP-dependent Clp protease adaptor ClpS [Bacteroidota bacterium]
MKRKRKKNSYDLVLYNDDLNSFDFVIETLIDVCNHEHLQAIQCTYIIHFNGKCGVKCGTYEKLEPLFSELIRRGLTAKII